MKKKYNIADLVLQTKEGNSKLNFLTGIYHKNGKRYASDKVMFVCDSEPYDEALEGRVLFPDGSVSERSDNILNKYERIIGQAIAMKTVPISTNPNIYPALFRNSRRREKRVGSPYYFGVCPWWNSGWVFRMELVEKFLIVQGHLEMKLGMMNLSDFGGGCAYSISDKGVVLMMAMHPGKVDHNDVLYCDDNLSLMGQASHIYDQLINRRDKESDHEVYSILLREGTLTLERLDDTSPYSLTFCWHVDLPSVTVAQPEPKPIDLDALTELIDALTDKMKVDIESTDRASMERKAKAEIALSNARTEAELVRKINNDFKEGKPWRK